MPVMFFCPRSVSSEPLNGISICVHFIFHRKRPYRAMKRGSTQRGNDFEEMHKRVLAKAIRGKSPCWAK